jgi:hypothetical protein
MQKQEAWLCQLYPFDSNDTAMHNKNVCKFDLDIYVRVKVHCHMQTATLFSFHNCQTSCWYSRQMLEIWRFMFKWPLPSFQGHSVELQIYFHRISKILARHLQICKMFVNALRIEWFMSTVSCYSIMYRNTCLHSSCYFSVNSAPIIMMFIYSESAMMCGVQDHFYVEKATLVY